MRFSDMMGSGADRSSKETAPAEPDPVIANALAPYLAAAEPPAAVPPAAEPAEPAELDPEPAEPASPIAVGERAEPLAGAARAEVTAIAPVAPARSAPPVHTAAVFAAAHQPPKEPTPTQPTDAKAGFADFTPLSDDLLPRRR